VRGDQPFTAHFSVMAKNDTVQKNSAVEKVVENEASVPAVAQRKTYTNWGAFAKAGLVPTEIMCNGYRPFHGVDISCHTRLRLDPAVMGEHVRADHGGGFSMTLRRGDRVWAGWKQFEDLGLEAVDLRCGVCGEELPFHPQHLLKHLRAHPNQNRRIVEGGQYLITLSFERPMESGDEFDG
jgi:hypothetical protein